MNGYDDKTARGTFSEHLGECDECRARGAAIGDLVQILSASADPLINQRALSQRVLMAARPQLASRARFVDWPRLAAAVLGGLIPLPLVLALNALFVATVHTLLVMVGLPTIASYVVVSYAAGLVFALGATYAAIPVLAERSAGPRLLPLA